MTAADRNQNSPSTLTVWRERQCRNKRYRTIIVTLVRDSKVTGIDQDGRPVRMSRSTLLRGWSQIGHVDLRDVRPEWRYPWVGVQPERASRVNAPGGAS